MQQRRAVLKGATALAVAGLVAAGCGSSSKSSSSTSAASGATTATTAAATPTTAASATTTGGSASGGGGAVQGITASTITIGQLADVSGPVPGLFTGAVDGMDAWAAQVNSTGGIDGRKIVINHKDAALDCATYTNAFKGLSTSAFASVGTYSLVDVCGSAAVKANPNFPSVQGVVLNPALGAFPNVFGAIPAANGHATTGYLWVKGKYGASAVAKAGTLYGLASATIHMLEKPAAEAAGWKFVYERGIGSTETNYTSDILRMKSDGVQVVDLQDMSTGDLAGFLNQAAQQGFKPKAILTTAGYDAQLFKLVGGSGANANPLVFPLPYAMYLGEDAAAVPEITTMTTWLKKTHPGDPMNLFVMEAYAAGLLFQQGMAKMGSNPTQAGLISAVTAMTAFTANGLLPPSNVGGKQGVVCSVIVQAQNGKFVRVDPADKGFECNGSFVTQPIKS